MFINPFLQVLRFTHLVVICMTSAPARLADTLPCTVAVGTKRVQLFFVVDPTALMLVQRHPDRAGHAQVVMAVPLRHQEAFLNRNNVCVLHITIRSMTRPHASCRRLKQGAASLPNASPVVGGSASAPMGGTGATGSTGPAGIPTSSTPSFTDNGNTSGMALWNLTLLFGDRSQCAIAKRHLEQTRATIRTDLIANILRSFDDEQQLLLAHSGVARGRRASSITLPSTITSVGGHASSSSTAATASSSSVSSLNTSNISSPSTNPSSTLPLLPTSSHPLLSPSTSASSSSSMSPSTTTTSAPTTSHVRQPSKAPLMPSLRS
jgi:hypothetical protein